jgi:hypothetical protein
MTKQYDNYADLITFTRASTGTALRHVGYGSELVTNGTFDTDISGWTDNSSAGGSIAWNAAGYLDLDADAATSRASQDIAVTAGSVYAVSITVVNLGGSSASGLYLDGAASSSINFVVAGVGTHTIYYVAPDSLLNISIRNFTTGTTVSIDNVSFKEVIFDRATDPLVLFNHPTNVPRIEYDADGNRRGLLIEEARTNLILQSGNLEAAPWGAVNVTTSVDAGTAPDGSDMTLLTSTGVNSDTAVSQTTGASIGTTYTASVFVRRDQHRFAILFGFGNGTSGVAFDLVLGTAQVNATWVSAGIDIISPTIARIYGVVTPAVNSTLFVGLASSIGGLKVFSGGEALSFWGAQLEAGSFPTSYISTSGAAASRSADVASIPTSAFGYNQKAGTVVAEMNHPLANRAGSRKYVWNIKDSGNDRLSVRASDGVNSILEPRGVVGNGVSTTDFVSPVTTAASYKVALSYNDVNATMSVNGVLAAQSTAYAGNPQTTLALAQSGTGGSQPNGYLKSIQYYPRRLTNTQLQELTS